MKDIPLLKDLSSRNFIEKIATRLEIDKQILDMLGFETKKSFANDYVVSCASSYYQGIPCYFVKWSGIEHVFVDDKDFCLVLRDGMDKERQAKISELSDLVDDLIFDRKPTSDKAYYSLAAEFEKAHRETLNEYRIPLSAFAQYRCEHSKAFALFDRKNFGKEADFSSQRRADSDGPDFN